MDLTPEVIESVQEILRRPYPHEEYGDDDSGHWEEAVNREIRERGIDPASAYAELVRRGESRAMGPLMRLGAAGSAALPAVLETYHAHMDFDTPSPGFWEGTGKRRSRLLGIIGGIGVSAVPCLVTALSWRPTRYGVPIDDVRLPVVEALGSFYQAAVPAIPALISVFEDPGYDIYDNPDGNPLLRDEVAQALGRIGSGWHPSDASLRRSHHPVALQALLRGLQHAVEDDPEGQWNCPSIPKALYEFNEAARAGARLLEKGLTHSSPAFRRAAAAALERLNGLNGIEG